MPIYEYECLECGIDFDKLQRFGDPQPSACPNGHHRVHRILSQPTIIFKGPGFYVTDNNRTGRYGRNGRASATGKKNQKTETKATPSPTTQAKPG